MFSTSILSVVLPVLSALATYIILQNILLPIVVAIVITWLVMPVNKQPTIKQTTTKLKVH